MRLGSGSTQSHFCDRPKVPPLTPNLNWLFSAEQVRISSLLMTSPVGFSFRIGLRFAGGRQLPIHDNSSWT